MWVAAAVAAAWTLCGTASAQDLVTTRGYLMGAAVEKGVLWMRFGRDQKRFEVDLRKVADPQAAIAVVQAAAKETGAVEVRFDPRSGTFMPATPDVPTYRVRELSFGDLKAAGEPAAAAGPTRADDAPASLALGMALTPGGFFEPAKAAFDQALAGKLPKPLVVLAHRERGTLLRERAYLVAPEPTPEADTLLAAALADFQSWRALAPKDDEAAQAVAGVLTELGGYEEALAIYRGVDEVYWANIRIGAIHRRRGEYDQALAALDEIVRRAGPQPGMGWHYHRGWTLADMGRHAEAVEAFTAGLASQPDYSWALLRRACSLAQLGRLSDALADQTRGVTLRRASLKDTESTPATEHDTARAEQILTDLKARVALGDAQPSGVACGGYWAATEAKRGRSPLLPAT